MPSAYPPARNNRKQNGCVSGTLCYDRLGFRKAGRHSVWTLPSHAAQANHVSMRKSKGTLGLYR